MDTRFNQEEILDFYLKELLNEDESEISSGKKIRRDIPTEINIRASLQAVWTNIENLYLTAIKAREDRKWTKLQMVGNQIKMHDYTNMYDLAIQNQDENKRSRLMLLDPKTCTEIMVRQANVVFDTIGFEDETLNSFAVEKIYYTDEAIMYMLQNAFNGKRLFVRAVCNDEGEWKIDTNQFYFNYLEDNDLIPDHKIALISTTSNYKLVYDEKNYAAVDDIMQGILEDLGTFRRAEFIL